MLRAPNCTRQPRRIRLPLSPSGQRFLSRQH
jgi:hypothetical protein